MEASCTVQTLRNSCKFFSESDKKKLARAISKNQVSDPGPSWPSCRLVIIPDHGTHNQGGLEELLAADKSCTANKKQSSMLFYL